MTEFYFFFLDQHATQTCSQGRFGAEMGNDMFGAAIMGYNPDIDSQKCVMRIENVELNYVGQAYRYDLIDWSIDTQWLMWKLHGNSFCEA